MKRNAKKGFTLVEVIIAIGLLTLIGMIVLNLVYLSNNIKNVNYQRQEALKVTSSYIDEIKSYQVTWKDLNGLRNWLPTKGYTQINSNEYKILANDSHGIQYESSLTITPDTGISGLFQVEIATKSPKVNQLTILTRFRG